MPRGHFNSYFFCREVEVILFTVSLFFTREVFVFAVSLFLLIWPRAVSFCPEVNSFAVTVVSYRTLQLAPPPKQKNPHPKFPQRRGLHALQRGWKKVSWSTNLLSRYFSVHIFGWLNLNLYFSFGRARGGVIHNNMNTDLRFLAVIWPRISAIKVVQVCNKTCFTIVIILKWCLHPLHLFRHGIF